MAEPCLLGIDSGLTMTKAVVFETKGHVRATARRRIAQSIPQPRRVERDMTALWRATSEAIREALQAAGQPEIAAVAATAHGDGVYLLDREGQPLGPGILSLDSRAGVIVAGWEADGTSSLALPLSGQMPHASAPSALLAWIAAHEPERYARIGHVLACKDWLRLCLSGTIGTDLTEASTSFTDVTTQDWSGKILELYGLQVMRPALPSIARPDEVVGRITAAAAALTCANRASPAPSSTRATSAPAPRPRRHG